MNGIQLQGWLGNQMFQYAAARTLADKLGCGLLIAGQTVAPRLGVIGHWLGLDARGPNPALPQLGLQRNGILNSAFGCGPSVLQGRLVELAMPMLRRAFFRQTFSPARIAAGESDYEHFDATFHDQPSGTWLDGWFQSERYFAGNGDLVRQWFQPRPAHVRKLRELMSEWPATPSEMVAVHVRRGDYALIRDSVSDNESGWLLPMTYYDDAMQQVPADAPLAGFSDDPDWAAQAFADRRPWVSRNNSSVIDMMLIAQCRWNVIANSSFSWWAAWLNANPDKVVIAPRYHLGWKIGRWVPGGIEVAGWDYLTVRPS